MSTPRTAALPDEFEMSLRLRRVDDTYYVVEHLHRELILYAGQRMTGLGIVTMLDHALLSYSTQLEPGVFDCDFWLPRYLRVLVDDDQVHKDAIEVLRKLERI